MWTESTGSREFPPTFRNSGVRKERRFAADAAAALVSVVLRLNFTSRRVMTGRDTVIGPRAPASDPQIHMVSHHLKQKRFMSPKCSSQPTKVLHTCRDSILNRELEISAASKGLKEVSLAVKSGLNDDVDEWGVFTTVRDR